MQSALSGWLTRIVMSGARARANLEGQPRGQHEHEHELEVLIDGPEALHSALRVADEELERCGRQDLVREEQTQVEEDRRPKYDRREDLALVLGQPGHDVRDDLVQNGGRRDQQARVA